METNQSNALSVFTYQGNNITFQTGDGVMMNATQMARPFGKTTKDWLRTDQSKEFINSLSAVRHISLTELVKVIRGGEPGMQGTWLHEDVALEFARWLSPVFAIWCNDRIKELLTRGVTTISDDDAVIAQAMDVLQRRLHASKEREKYERMRAETLELQTAEQQKQLLESAPKVEYYEEVISSSSLLTVNQIAQELGMSAIKLNQILCEKEIQYRQSNSYLLYAKYREKGYAQIRPHTFTDKYGKQQTHQHLYWTEKGKQFILSLLKK